MKYIKVFQDATSKSVHINQDKYFMGTLKIYKKETSVSLYDKISKLMGRHKFLTEHYDHSGICVVFGKCIGYMEYIPDHHNAIRCSHEETNLCYILPDVVFVMFGTFVCHHIPNYANDTCIICQRTRISGDRLIMNSTCGHELFCRECSEYVRENGTILSCPICGQHITDLQIMDCPYSCCYVCNRFIHDETCELNGKLPWKEQIFR